MLYIGKGLVSDVCYDSEMTHENNIWDNAISTNTLKFRSFWDAATKWFLFQLIYKINRKNNFFVNMYDMAWLKIIIGMIETPPHHQHLGYLHRLTCEM